MVSWSYLDVGLLATSARESHLSEINVSMYENSMINCDFFLVLHILFDEPVTFYTKKVPLIFNMLYTRTYKQTGALENI